MPLTGEHGMGRDADDVAGWVLAARRGESWAWRALIGRYERMVGSVGRRYGLSPADSAEAAQVTWVKLVEHIDRIQQPDRVGGWLMTTAQRECLRIRRGLTRTAPAGNDVLEEMPDGDAVDPDSRPIAEERERALRAAYARLSARERRMLDMLFGDAELSYRQLSEALGMPIGSIGPTRGRCLEHLRRLLGSQLAVA